MEPNTNFQPINPNAPTPQNEPSIVPHGETTSPPVQSFTSPSPQPSPQQVPTTATPIPAQPTLVAPIAPMDTHAQPISTVPQQPEQVGQFNQGPFVAPAPTIVAPADNGALIQPQQLISAPVPPQPQPVVVAPINPGTSQPPTSPVISSPQLVVSPMGQPIAQQPVVAPTIGVVNDGQIHIGGETGATAVAAGQFTPPNFAAKKRKKILFGAASAMSVALLAGLFVFFFYIPNTPKGVWRVGMGRTGSEVTALIKAMDDPKATVALQKSKITVDGSLDYNGKVSKLTFDSKYDESKTDETMHVTANIPDVPAIDITAALKTQLPEGAMLPNFYFKVAGYSSLGLDSYAPGINDYDGKWIAVEQDYLKQFEQSLGEDSVTSTGNITQDEYMSMINDANEVTQEYIFTADPNKSVIELGEFVATEDSEGIKANHYKAKINKDNLQTYCTAMFEKMSANEAIKKHKLLANTTSTEAKQQCKDSIKEIDSDKTYDVWFDKKNKLFHKIRFSEDLKGQAAKNEQDKAECIANEQSYGSYGDASYCDMYDDYTETGEAYTDVGQIYEGNNKFVVFVSQKRDTNKDKSTYRAELTLNAKTYQWGGKITGTSNNNGQAIKLEVNIAAEPYSGSVDAEKPAGAIPIQQIIDRFSQPTTSGQDSAFSAGSKLLPGVDLSQLPFNLF